MFDNIPEIIYFDEMVYRFKMTERLKIILDNFNIFFTQKQFDYPEFFDMRTNIIIEEFSNFPQSRDLYTCGSFSYSESFMSNWEWQLGRYCSVAENVRLIGERHPMEYVTTSSLTYNYMYRGFEAAQNKLLNGQFPPDPPNNLYERGVYTGHDVWIGQNVLIKRGIEIGTGSIIAAGSVVTKDVLPYEIVGGVPAKRIRMRFPDRIVAKLLELNWWNYHPKYLYEFGYKDISGFINSFSRVDLADREIFNPKKYTVYDIINALKE